MLRDCFFTMLFASAIDYLRRLRLIRRSIFRLIIAMLADNATAMRLLPCLFQHVAIITLL